MCTLKIEHPIADFETWKRSFERDPVGREQRGVRRYRIFRPIDDPRYVMIELDFDGHAEARAFLASLQKLWERVDLTPGLLRESGAPKVSPRATIVDQVESREYGAASHK